MPIQLVASGRFKSNGSAKSIALRSGFDYFEVENQTQMATGANANTVVRARWYAGLDDGSALIDFKNSSNALLGGYQDGKTPGSSTLTYIGGFSLQDQSNQALGPAVTVTSVSQADGAVVVANSHGLSVGDRIIFSGTTGMLQIAGIAFEVTVVTNANQFTLGSLDSSGFANPASGGNLRKLPAVSPFFPYNLSITEISAAPNAVVAFGVTHNMVVGQKFRFYVPIAHGANKYSNMMVQLNGQLATVLSVDTTNNEVTVDVNTSAYTAFGFPLSADAAKGWTPAQAVPVGESALITSQAERNQEQIVMVLAAGAAAPAGINNDVIYWRAWQAGFTNYEF